MVFLLIKNDTFPEFIQKFVLYGKEKKEDLCSKIDQFPSFTTDQNGTINLYRHMLHTN